MRQTRSRHGILAAILAFSVAPAIAAPLQAGTIQFQESGAPRAERPYRPSDVIQGGVDLSGYTTGPNGRFKVRMKVSITDAAGNRIAGDEGLLQFPAPKGLPPIPQTFTLPLPSYLAAGKYRVTVQSRDELTGLDAQSARAFTIERASPPTVARGLEVRALFFSTAVGGSPVRPPVFDFGKAFFYRFEIAGLKFRGNTVDLRLGFKLQAPDGTVVADEPALVEGPQNFAWHPDYFTVPFTGNLELPPGAPDGKYLLTWTLTDKLAGKSVTHSAAVEVKPSRELGFANCELREGKDGPAQGTRPYKAGGQVFAYCEVVGYAVGPDGKSKVVAKMKVLDPDGVSMTDPVESTVDAAIPADRPPIIERFNLELPRFVPAGEYSMKIRALDAVASRTASTELKFRIARDRPALVSRKLEVREFAYAGAKSGPRRDNATFKSGETVYFSFEIGGLAFRGDALDVRVAHRLLAPDGSVLAEQPELAKLEQKIGYHPPTFAVAIGGNVRLAAKAAGGRYTNEIVVTDQVAGKSVRFTSAFTLMR